MARYIDAEIAEELIIKKLRDPEYQHEGEGWRCGLVMAEDAIEDVPTADVAEVKHGRWVKKYRGNYLCSVCGAWYRTTDDYGNIIDGEMKSNYCESCGAKMDE